MSTPASTGPREAGTFASLADRRTWLANLPLPPNDSDISPVLACPTLARFSKENDGRRARVLAWWGSEMRPAQMPVGLDAANDNDPLDHDRLLEIRPTISELLSSSCRVSVSRTRAADGKWGEIRRRPNQLKIARSEIVGWFDRNGVERRAGVKLMGVKGGAQKSRTQADIARYLDRPGSPFPEQWAAFDGGRQWDRTDRALAADAILKEAIANTTTMPAVKKYPPAIAKGAHWFGGQVASTGRKANVNAAAVDEELTQRRRAKLTRDQIGETTARLLDMAATRMTARDIGAAFGYTGKYAERWAVREINRAIDKIAA